MRVVKVLNNSLVFAQRLVSCNQLPEDRFVKERFDVKVTNREEMYLALHIHSVLEGERIKG